MPFEFPAVSCSEQQSHPIHRIRSFIRRQGRATTGQKLALETLWEKYCLAPHTHYDFEHVFARKAPLIIEIGFGNGAALAQMAADHPDTNFIGIEVHRPGVGHLMMLLDQQGLNNVRIFHHDAIEILEQSIADCSISGVHLFFPDPWQKRRHHKRRIVKPSFIDLLKKKLITNGYFHAATDWENYAKDMLSVLSADTGLINQSLDKRFCERPDYRPLTKFEQRGLKLGHGVWDLIFRKP